MQTLVAVNRGARPGLTLQVGDRCFVGKHLDDKVALRLAALDVVGPDVTEDARRRRDAAVDGDDRHLGVDRLLQSGSHRVDVDRADHDASDALGQRRLDVGGVWRPVLAVTFEDDETLLLALRLESLHSGRRKGKFIPGTEAGRIDGPSSAKAAAKASAKRTAVATRRVMRMKIPPWAG